MTKNTQVLDAFGSDQALITADTVRAVVLVSALTMAALLGISLAIGLYVLVIALLVLVTGMTLIAYPIVGVWVVIVGSLAVAGLIDLYIPLLKPLIWGLPLLSVGVAGIALIKTPFDQTNHGNVRKQEAWLVGWLLFFALIVVFSSLINWHGILGFVVGLKSYFQIGGLLIGICYLIKGEMDAKRLITFFLLLGVIQLPFVLHEFLVLAPLRSTEVFARQGMVAGDIVAGTFGGSMMGGGRSSNLVLLTVICITIVLAQWRVGQRTALFATLATLFFLLPMFISEAKLILVFLPIALFLLFRDRILSNPLKTFIGIVGLATLLMSLFFSYTLLPGAKSQHVSSVQNMLRENIEYNIGKRGYGIWELNRTTVYHFWLKEHERSDMLVPTLVGHGAGSANNRTFFNDDTLAYKRYRNMGIGLTGLSSLLWEVGLLGTIAVLAMFVSAYRLSGRLVRLWQGTIHWPYLKTAQISIFLFAFSLLHNNYFVYEISFQVMLIVLIGYLLVMARCKNATT